MQEREKQIEEMARVMANGRFIEPDRNQILLFAGEAETLYNAGYRKASDIFAEIENVIGEKYDYYVFDNMNIEGVEQDAIIAFADTMKRYFAEIKKKHTEGKQ